MRVLILDQFTGPSPYELQARPRLFEDVVAEQMALAHPWKRPRLEDVDPEAFTLEMCTTVLRAREDGYAEVWRARWDSSG